MPQTNASKHGIMVSILGRDRQGLVADITGYLHDEGASLGEMSFSVLGEGAEFTALCLFPDQPPARLQADLKTIPGLADATISVVDFSLSPYHDSAGDITHHIVVRGTDRPGLIARLSEVLVQHKASVVRMSAETHHATPIDEYIISMSISLAPSRAQGCLAALGNTAEEQGMSYVVTPVDPDPTA